MNISQRHLRAGDSGPGAPAAGGYYVAEHRQIPPPLPDIQPAIGQEINLSEEKAEQEIQV